MSFRILQGSVFDRLPEIKPGSVDCCVTSPPYWMLRSYLKKGHPLKHLELGSEATPGEFVANMVKVFGMVRDAMAEHAVCWVNIGDTYSGGGGGNYGTGKNAKHSDGTTYTTHATKDSGIDTGNLCLIHQRLTIALQDDGWLVRSVVVWHKPAPMPASLSGWAWKRCRVKEKASGQTFEKFGQVNRTMPDNSGGVTNSPRAEWADCPGCRKCTPNGGYVLRRGSWRPTSSWEPILMLAKSSNYFADGEPVKTPASAATVSRDQYTRVLDDPDEQFAVRHDHETVCDSGANLRDVWTIAAEPLKQAHYASFPSELVRRCLASSVSAKGYCPACGGPWVRMVSAASGGTIGKGDWKGDADGEVSGLSDTPINPGSHYDTYKRGETLGWKPSCSCPQQEPRPGLVLDPFCGSGRTALQALRLGFDFVGCELNSDYVEMAERLIMDESPLFN